MAKKTRQLTTTAGAVVADNQNSVTAGPHGPLLVQDYQLIEKLAHQNRERIPERVVHAKGSGAYGTFEVTRNVKQYTCADFLSAVGKKTRVLARFSTVAGERGAADAERDVRGFALKFYTKQGNWDMVGNNTPIFFVRDPLKFPDFIHTQKRHPQTHLRNPTAVWDFWSLSPESLHQITILFSDRGLPCNYRQMNGYGSHTYSMYNKKGERFWVKFHFKSMQGHAHYTNAEAAKIIGQSRETAQEDLFGSIAARRYPKWRFCLQVMPELDAEKYERHTGHNPFDLTKVWSHKDYPLIEVGVLTLNENPQNYFAEIEQSSFSPSNIVPGISFSPDKMLQARIFAYADAHRYRVGTHYENLPVNRPAATADHYHLDGQMRFDAPSGTDAYYEPNSMDGPVDNPALKEPPMKLDATTIDRFDHRQGNDDYSQASDLFHMFNKKQKARLFSNIADSMEGVPAKIIKRQLKHFSKVDAAYGQGVADALAARNKGKGHKAA